MLKKLTSRKFLVSLGGFISVLVSELAGVELSAEAIAGLAAIVGFYVTGEGMVDRKAIEASMSEMKLDALATASLLNHNLQLQLAALMEGEKTDPEFQPTPPF